MLERNNIEKENKFLLSAEEKVALMEAKVKRAEAQVHALVEQIKLMEAIKTRS